MSPRLGRAAALAVRPSDVAPVWGAASAVLSDAAQRFCEGVSVRCYPRASAPAPGCCYTDLGTILLDGELVSEPEALGGESLSEETRRELCALTGVLVHECGHARHTLSEVALAAPPELLAEVKLLEEARMETRLCERRPEARRFIQAAVRQINAPHLPDPGEPVSRGEAAQVLAVLGGRVHAETLPAELGPAVKELGRAGLGADDAARIEALLARVCAIADGDADAMIDAAREYREIVGEPEAPAGGSLAGALGALVEALGAAEGEGQAALVEGDGDGEETDAPGLLRAREVLEAIEAALGGEIESAKVRQAMRGRGGAAGGLPGGEIPPAQPGGPPGPLELRAAAALERRLRRVSARRVGREGARRPGRFHAPGALRSAADRALGRGVDRDAFRRRELVRAPLWAPEVAVLIDTSGSMSGHHAELGRVLWTCHRAVRRLGGRLAGAGFGAGSALLCPGGDKLARVPLLRCAGGTGNVDEAIRLCEEELRLSDPRRARLCVVVSDGEMYDADQEREAIERLRGIGVGVVHIGIERPPAPMGADRLVCVPDAHAAGEVLGDQCRAVLEGRAGRA